MRKIKIALSAVFVLYSSFLHATPEEDVRATAMLWIEGMSLGDPDYMISLYDEDAILHGTVSPIVRRGHTLIREYFAANTDNPPTMFFIEPMNIRVFGDTAVNTGNYGADFSGNEIIMRYSFVYHKEGDTWKIVDHHSSTMPE